MSTETLITPLQVEKPVLPSIYVTNRQLRDLSDEAWSALLRSNDPPKLFTRAGELVRVRDDKATRPTVEVVTDSILRSYLTDAADFFRATSTAPVAISPPVNVAKDILSKESWDFPALAGLIEAPVVRTDGSILDRPGYDPESGLYYARSPTLSIPALPDTPKRANIREAVRLLDEAIGEFPFADLSSKANLIGTLLTPFIRATLDGPSPLALIDAPQQGTGKSLLTNVVSLIATGHNAAMMSAPSTEDEWRKRITATLYSGSSVVVIDNLEGRLESPSLASAVTSLIWRDRYLGASKMIDIPQRATWIGNGNNIRLGGDLQRRCYWIRLDSKSSQPWLGRKYRKPDLLGWVASHRRELLWAVLTLAKAWYMKGMPKPRTDTLGGFEKWCTTVGGILSVAGIEGFLSNLQEMYAVADEETREWEQFYLALKALAENGPFTVTSVVSRLDEGDWQHHLPDDLETVFTQNRNGFSRSLGRALGKREGRRYGSSESYVERAGTSRDGQVWIIKTVSDASPP
jgi:hypothetical protein